MLEPCEVKVSRTVLRGERGREASDLPDHSRKNNRRIINEAESQLDLNQGGTEMKRNTAQLFVCLMLLTLLVGCAAPATNITTRLMQGPELDRARPIKVFKIDETPSYDYVILGVVNSALESDQRFACREDARLEALKAEASSMGADSIVGYYADKIVGPFIGYCWSSALAVRSRRDGEEPMKLTPGYMVVIPKVAINKVVDSEERASVLDNVARRYAQYYLAWKGYYAVQINEPTPDPIVVGFQAMNEANLNKYGGPQAQYILGIKFLDKSYGTILIGSKESVTLETTLYSKLQGRSVFQRNATGYMATGFLLNAANVLSEKRMQEAIRGAVSYSLKEAPNISTNGRKE